MRQKVFKLQGIVIDKFERGEKDILYTLLTSEDGKMSVLAKYAKKVPSRHNSGLELFNGVECQLHQGKVWPVVTQSKQILSFPSILHDYQKLKAAFHIVSLLNTMILPGQPTGHLYPFVCKTLALLDAVDETQIQTVFTTFQFKLLRMLGFFHVADACEKCGEIFEKQLRFHSSRYLCPTCSEEEGMLLSKGTNDLLIQFSSKTFEEILNLYVAATTLQTINHFFDQYLAAQFPDRRKSLQW